MQTEKAEFSNTTLQVRSELFLDESRHSALPLLLPHQKRFQILCDSSIEKRGFRTSGTIRYRGVHASGSIARIPPFQRLDPQDLGRRTPGNRAQSGIHFCIFHDSFWCWTALSLRWSSGNARRRINPSPDGSCYVHRVSLSTLHQLHGPSGGIDWNEQR